MKLFTILAALSMAATTATAQVIIQPIRYQYGEYNEVFYGGHNPAYTNNSYVYLPPALESAYIIQRLSAAPGENPYQPYGPQGPFVSPLIPGSAITNPSSAPYIFSDYLPNLEVGQFGYTINDVRNEAYANVPRIETGYQGASPQAPAAAAAESPAPPVEVQVVADQRPKAIPLLNWAKAERTRNPELYKALIEEAKKYDPSATAAMEKSVASEK